MRTSIPAFSGLALLSAALPALLAAAPAAAQDAADPPAPVTVSVNATLVSDYRFRGILQTDKDPTIQGGFSVNHQSGFYVAVWGSGISNYVAAGSDVEVDLSAGYRATLGSGTTLDVGALYYFYPGSGKGITGPYASDFVETYASLSHSIGPVSAKLTAAYSPKQSALSVGSGREDNLYIAGDFGVGVPDTPVGLTAHIGHTFGPSYLSIGDEYTDWGVGATYTMGKVTAGLSYADTNKTLRSPSGENISGSTILGTIGVAF